MTRNVVRPHTWQVFANIAEIERDKQWSIQNDTVGMGQWPTQADAGSRRRGRSQVAGVIEL